MKSLRTLLTMALSLAATAALAVGPAPAPMKQKEVLSVGFVKVGHLAPMLMLEEELKKLTAMETRLRDDQDNLTEVLCANLNIPDD